MRSTIYNMSGRVGVLLITARDCPRLPGDCPGTARGLPETARVRETARELETARGLETTRGHRIQYNCPEKGEKIKNFDDHK